jgi:hypothetical protein
MYIPIHFFAKINMYIPTYITVSVEKNLPQNGTISENFKKLPKENNRPIGENSPNLDGEIFKI